ncbi:MAG: MFS transporter [Pseudomonadota bacterium]|nr:MFS transporter [Pseudomonadota bacterium]
MLITFTLIAVISTALLWFAKPSPEYMLWALIFVGIGNFAFESGMVFYNSMLPDITEDNAIGRVSGWSWGLGYAGGLVCLSLALIAFVQTDNPWFGVGKEQAAHIRATAILVAVWFLLFAVPLFIFTPDRDSRGVKYSFAILDGISSTFKTLKHLDKSLLRYLIARMLYSDGLTTLFAFGGIYAAGTFGFSFSEIILFGIAINVTAGVGAISFAWIDDLLGSKLTILVSLTALILLSTTLLIVETKLYFWLFGLSLGTFVGPVQSASRSLMAHMAPVGLRTEMFGLYAFSGKATSFLGPAALAYITDLFQNQRLGMATIILFLLMGALLLLLVENPNSRLQSKKIV